MLFVFIAYFKKQTYYLGSLRCMLMSTGWCAMSNPWRTL